MTIEELKAKIENNAGVPAVLLNGETAEENIAQAKALLAYKRRTEQEQSHNKSTGEQFAEWFSKSAGIEAENDPAIQALQIIENEMRIVPVLNDAGENLNYTAAGNTKEQFSAWLNDRLSFNPMKTDLQ